MELYYVDEDGVYLGAFDGIVPPDAFDDVPTPPEDPRMIWDFDLEEWGGFVIPKDYQVWEYVRDYTGDKKKFPSGVNIESDLTQALYPVHGFTSDLLTSTIFYAEFEDNLDGTFTYSVPVAYYSYVYTPFEDADVQREILIQWYYFDEELDPVQESKIRTLPDNPLNLDVRMEEGRVVNVYKNVGTPLSDTEAAPKAYVDGLFEDVLSSVYFIPADAEIFVPLYQQMINLGGLDIEGILDVNGQVFLEE